MPLCREAAQEAMCDRGCVDQAPFIGAITVSPNCDIMSSFCCSDASGPQV